MNITKKFLSALTATMCAATASVCGLSVSAAEISDADVMVSGDLTYMHVYEDEDELADYVRIVDCSSTAQSILIPATIDELVVKEIEPGAFYDSNDLISINVDPQNDHFSADNGILFNKKATTLICHPSAKAAESYTVPASVSTIADYAFANCKQMSNVEILDNGSVTSIGDYAFLNCEALNAISIPPTVEAVGTDAFYGTGLLKKQLVEAELLNKDQPSLYYADTWVIYSDEDVATVMSSTTSIKNNTTGIAGGSFANRSSLTKIDIPSNVKYIGESAFSNCTSLSAVSLPESVKAIGSRAFYGCTSIIDLSIPNSVTTVGEGAFYNCEKLATINIPTGVSKVAASTFENCAGLAKINIPENVKEIEKRAFYNCSLLDTIEIMNKNCLINDAPHTFSNSGTSYKGAIYGYEGSTAQIHADKYNILFKTLNASSVNPSGMSGDANQDGTVDVRDAACIATTLAKGLNLPISADYDGDGDCNIRDAAAIATALANGKL